MAWLLALVVGCCWVSGLVGVVAPSMREVGRALGIGSTNAVNDHYEALIRKGLLARDPLKSRAVRPTVAGLRELGLGVCSHCAGTGLDQTRGEA